MASELNPPHGAPVEQFLSALHDGDVERVRSLLEEHAEVRAAVNAPIGDFDSRPVAAAKKNLPLLDVLLAHGADLNLKSAWWAGGFGLLEYGCTPEQAAPLIARGAIVDVFAAAHLGMFDRLRELVDARPVARSRPRRRRQDAAALRAHGRDRAIPDRPRRRPRRA